MVANLDAHPNGSNHIGSIPSGDSHGTYLFREGEQTRMDVAGSPSRWQALQKLRQHGLDRAASSISLSTRGMYYRWIHKYQVFCSDMHRFPLLLSEDLALSFLAWLDLIHDDGKYATTAVDALTWWFESQGKSTRWKTKLVLKSTQGLKERLDLLECDSQSLWHCHPLPSLIG